jgi:hypothetical protein
MKDQLLKIAKVKSEKEFYKKYPTEEAFMKAHGKAFKKAAMGKAMVAEQLDQLTDFSGEPKAQVGTMIGGGSSAPNAKPMAFNDLMAGASANNMGITKEQYQKQQDTQALAANAAPAKQDDGGFGNMLSEVATHFTEGDTGEYGYSLPMAQNGFDFTKLGNVIGTGFQKQGGLGSGLADMFGGKGTSKGIMDASQNMFKGKGLVGGLKTLGTSEGLGAAGKAAGLGVLNAAPQILQGIGQIKEQKAAIKKADQSAQISGLTAQAAESQPQLQKNRYVRPEDTLVQPGQLGNPQGGGTNYLAQNGTTVGGNKTEIQNSYNSPLDIYSNLGYTPLSNGDVKQYAYGGNLPTAEFGDYFQDSGQASIGKGVGSAIGSAFGPLGSTIGGFLGGVAGNLLGGADDANKLAGFQDTTKKNTERAAWAQGAQNIHSTYSSNMEDGGWVSNDWQPQVIATFGEHKLKDLLQPPHDADMLRAGGHLKEYTPPSAEAMYTGREQFAMGGDLKVHRGKAETMSYNPYLPEGGETVMFRGPSHDNGGMPISYGENGVEVEGGEPAVKLADGGSPDGNLVVFGNMMIPDYGVKEIGDDKAKGKKFKHYIADLSKVEAKQNRIIDKSIKTVNSIDSDNPFDQLAMNASRANLLGANMKLKDIAGKKQAAAMVQNAILDTANEFGVESDGLSKGQIKPIKDPLIGRDGKKLSKAQSGSIVDLLAKNNQKTDKSSRAALAESLGIVKKAKDYVGSAKQNSALYNAYSNFSKGGVNNNVTIPYAPAPASGVLDFLKKAPFLNPNNATNNNIVPYSPGYTGNSLPDVTVSAKRKTVDHPPSIEDMPGDIKGPKGKKGKGKFDWNTAALTLASGLGDYFRPHTKSTLDPNQLMGEMYALGSNQQEPVYAQTYQPMLDNPYDISLQDQVNAIDSQSRAAIRAAGNDPASQAYIMSQAADLKNKVLGEQMRINQANKAQVYQANRAAINDAVLKNIGILDTQQVRQATAKSKTKEQAIEALGSIASKIAQNKLENRNLNVMENLYGYRFNEAGTVYNANNPYFFNNPTVGANSLGNMSEYEKAKAITNAYEKKFKNEGKEEKRNGAIVKALKNI